MIKRKDVITLRIPFPSISSDLAVYSHMYICHDNTGTQYGFVKCQTLKPYMLSTHVLSHYWDEQPDSSRNPFQRTTRIDCDKLFVTNSVRYDDKLKTSSRPDVSDDVMQHVDAELIADGYVTHPLDEDKLQQLNRLVTKTV